MEKQEVTETALDETANSPTPTKKELKAAKKAARLAKKLDKKEGRRVKTILPMNAFMPFIMKKRCDACNMVETDFDVAAAEEYIHRKRDEGLKGFGFMHLFVASYVRTLAEYPGINRFIRGQRIMSRYNIEVVMTIKKTMTLNRGETCVKFFPQKNYTAAEVFNAMEAVLDEVMQTDDSSFDKTAAAFARMPRFLLRGIVHLLHFLDYYHKLPRFLTKLSPFHGSLIITSMGSLGIPPIYHHIYNFGNLPIFLSYGTVEKENVLCSDGSVSVRRYIPIKIVCDERIADGHHYASFFKRMRYYFTHPELLDTPPAEIKEDIP